MWLFSKAQCNKWNNIRFALIKNSKKFFGSETKGRTKKSERNRGNEERERRSVLKKLQTTKD